MNSTGTIDSGFCPIFHSAAELIGRRWTGAILRALFSGQSRFNDIKATIPDLTPRMLSERLKELEVEGIVTRRVIPEPLGTEYCLTPKGQALRPVLDAISLWANDWLVPDDAGTSSEPELDEAAARVRQAASG
jgi:DNA-binding HxlR family transcriptional regulator